MRFYIVLKLNFPFRKSQKKIAAVLIWSKNFSLIEHAPFEICVNLQFSNQNLRLEGPYTKYNTKQMMQSQYKVHSHNKDTTNSRHLPQIREDKLGTQL